MADNFQFTNNASALLAGSINDVETTLTVEAGYGALFPTPSGTQKFRAAIQDANGNLEIVNVTGRTTDTLTIERGAEGTTAQSWTLGVSRIELRVTKETMEEFLQKNGGTMTGTLDMNQNTIQDAVIDGANTKIQGGEIVNVPLRGTTGVSSNEVAVPTDGSRATAGGSAVLTQADLASNGGLNLLPINSIIMWYGTPASLPPGWQLCDGTGGTPDLTDRVPIGAGGTYSLGVGGGSTTASGTTSAAGGHTHGGATGSHILTEAEIPAHQHLGGGSYRWAPYDPWGQTDPYGAVERATNIWEHHQARPLGAWKAAQFYTNNVGGGSGHTHSLSTESDHTHSVASISVLQPYRAVYFIMKVS